MQRKPLDRLDLDGLISVLHEYRERYGNLAVLVTWESISRELVRQSVFRDDDGDVLWIDGDNCYYREDMRHADEPETVYDGETE